MRTDNTTTYEMTVTASAIPTWVLVTACGIGLLIVLGTTLLLWAQSRRGTRTKTPA